MPSPRHPTHDPFRREVYVPCPKGIEDALLGEFQRLSVSEPRALMGGVTGYADQRTAYALNLHLRSGIRVQELLMEGPIRFARDLYHMALQVPWEDLVAQRSASGRPVGRRMCSIAVHASTRHEEFRDSRFAALLVKDAVADRCRDVFNQRPYVNREDPDLPLRVVVKDGYAKLYRDLSGDSLHKRGWRPIQVKSPLNEALAAGLLLLAGAAEGDIGPILDPMCGSGTFVTEAASLALNRAPGLSRRFAFERWPDFDRELWDSLRDEALLSELQEPPYPVLGADHHGGALDLARQGAVRAGVDRAVRFSKRMVTGLDPYPTPKTVVVNPPYGIRLGEGEELVQTWKDLGEFLHRLESGTAWVLSGNPELTRYLGLRASRKIPVMNGGIECRWLKYELGTGRHAPEATEPDGFESSGTADGPLDGENDDEGF